MQVPLKGSEKLNLQIWVDHYMQSKEHGRLRAAMLAQLRKDIHVGCVPIRRLTLKDSGIAAYDLRASPAVEVNNNQGMINISPLARLVFAGELDAVRVLCQRLDLDLTRGSGGKAPLELADEISDLKVREEMKALLSAAKERADKHRANIKRLRV